MDSQLHYLPESGSFSASAQLLCHLSVSIRYLPEEIWAPPSNREIRYLYNLRGYKKGSPYISLESAVSFKPVLDLYSKFTMFKKEWFFIKDDSVSFRLFTSGCKLNSIRNFFVPTTMLLLICFYLLLATGGFVVVENDRLVQMAVEINAILGRDKVGFLPDQERHSPGVQLNSATSICG